MAKLLRKITVGVVNGIRGGFKGVTEKQRVLTVIGVAQGFKEKVSETMGVSYQFNGEFRAINKDGEESVAPVLYLPEPAQGLLHAALADEDRMGGVEFGFHFHIVPDASSVTGYVYECEPMVQPKPSEQVARLAQAIGYVPPQGALLGHDGGAETEAAPEAATKGKGGKK